MITWVCIVIPFPINDCFGEKSFDTIKNENVLFFELDCLKNSFKVFGSVGKGHTYLGERFQVPDCKISWHKSMLGNLYYDEEETRTCNDTDLVYLWSVGYGFIQAGADMNEAKTGCKCKTNK